MASIIEMQSPSRSAWDDGKICGYDIDMIDDKTTALIHQTARIWLIEEGSGTVKLQEREYQLKPGTVVSVLPWQITEITRVAETLVCHFIIYHFDSINHIIKYLYNVGNHALPLIQELESSPVIYCEEEQERVIRWIFSQIRQEVGLMAVENRDTAMDEPYVINKLVELVLQIHRIGSKNSSSYGKPAEDIKSSEILPYIYGHLSEKITLKSLSGRFYMSEAAISQYIKNTTGLSFFDLLNEMRVGKTINFLLYTDFSLEELAEILGFVDSAHISRVFAARIGMKANEYRKTYQRMNEFCKMKENPDAYHIVSYLYRNYAGKLTAKGVAAHFRMSVQELNRTVLYQVEKNFIDFVNFIRVNRACSLLSEKGMGVTEAAIEVGFGSAKTLTRNFLKFRLMTPGQFKSQVKLQEGYEER